MCQWVSLSPRISAYAMSLLTPSLSRGEGEREGMSVNHWHVHVQDKEVFSMLIWTWTGFWELILVICALLAVAALVRFLTVHPGAQWLFETVITQETVLQTGNAGVPFTGFKFQSPAVIVVHFCLGCTDFLFGDFVCLGFLFSSITAIDFGIICLSMLGFPAGCLFF